MQNPDNFEISFHLYFPSDENYHLKTIFLDIRTKHEHSKWFRVAVPRERISWDYNKFTIFINFAGKTYKKELQTWFNYPDAKIYGQSVTEVK